MQAKYSEFALPLSGDALYMIKTQKPSFEIEKNIGHLIIGIDEVGRGALAGPVVAAAVLFFQEPNIDGIKDSKKLSYNKRWLLFKEIITSAAEYSVGIASVEEINELNILNATHLAMRRAVLNMETEGRHIIVDGNANPFRGHSLENQTQAIIRGDNISITIAAASIIAKVTRDQIMERLSESQPLYDWWNNKGYGTKKHIEAIKKNGITEHHRMLFVRKV